MKKEEAIGRILEHQEIHSRKEPFTPLLDEAFRMAIEALKEMSVEEYRQRLMEVFHNTDHDELLTYVVMPKEEEFKSLEYILQAQPFEPRQRGEWKQITAKYGEYYCYHKCTNYGQTIESGFDNPPIFNFCPNCGASMVSVNSKIEKSNSKICPCIECCKIDNSEPCRKGCSDYQKWKESEME